MQFCSNLIGKRRENVNKLYYRPREIIALGYPRARVMELARKIGRKSNPEATRGFYFLLTLEEVKQHFGY